MRYFAIFFISTLLAAAPCFGQSTGDENGVVEVIVELDTNNNIGQMGDYVVELPASIHSCSSIAEIAEPAIFAAASLQSGLVAKFQPLHEDEDGIWTISGLTILSGECLTQELEELDEDNRVRINDTLSTQDAIAASESTDDTDSETEDSTADSTSTGSSTGSSSQTLIFENGVWKN